MVPSVLTEAPLDDPRYPKSDTLLLSRVSSARRFALRCKRSRVSNTRLFFCVISQRIKDRCSPQPLKIAFLGISTIHPQASWWPRSPWPQQLERQSEPPQTPS